MSCEKRSEREMKSVNKKSNIMPNKVVVIADPEVAVKSSLAGESLKSGRRLVIAFKTGYFAKTDYIHRPRGTMLPCLECSESFPTKLSLITHSKMHLKPFCVACHAYTESAYLLAVHIKESHPTLTKFYVKNDQNSENEGKHCNKGQAELNEKVSGEEACNRMEFADLANANNTKEAVPSDCPARLMSRFGRCITAKTLDF